MALKGQTPALCPRLADVGQGGASEGLVVVDGVGSDWLSLGCPSCTHLTTTPSFITKESNQLRPQVPGTADLSTAFHTLGVSQGPALPSSLEEQEVLPYPEDIPLLVLTAYPPPVVVFLQERRISNQWLHLFLIVFSLGKHSCL